MAEAALCVALLSLIVSGLTLYFNHLRRPRISLIVGSTIGLNHYDDGFSIHFPLTFNNAAHRPGLVNRCSLVLSKPDGGQVSHYIEWTEFRKRDQENRINVRDEFAGPLQIPDCSSVTKLAWFRWRNGPEIFIEGKYQLELIVWKENNNRPIREKHEFFIGRNDAQRLAEFKAGGKRTIKWMGVDKQIESNKLLTRHELDKLCG